MSPSSEAADLQTADQNMPVILDETSESYPQTGINALPFPPVTKSHILHCSYHYWHPRFRTITPKARLVPLTKPFVEYLRADGIILPSDDEAHDFRQREWSDTDSGVFSASDNADPRDDDSDDETEDIAAEWRQVHQSIKDTIAELGGRVMPKLNWSAPKDATWINANTMECRTPQEVYMLLKSSDFVTHDLEHAFADCVEEDGVGAARLSKDDIPYHLALRKSVPQFNPSVEFRCFVRERKLLCICQRDLNHFDFLSNMQDRLRSLIKEFFEVRIRDLFPDENFAFDVYVPQPYNRVWLVDFNPWAPRTDPLLFSWLELLTMPDPPESEPEPEPSTGEEQFVRLSLRPMSEELRNQIRSIEAAESNQDSETERKHEIDDDDEGENSDDDDEFDEEIWLPELRLVRKSDPEAYSFATPQYSAHKLPKDVVDASQSGEGLREFARDWQKILEQRQRQDVEYESSEDD